MQIDKSTVEKLADLAKIELNEREKDAMLNDMTKIMAFVDKINELDIEGVEPLIYMLEEENVLRKDEVNNQITKEEALKNAPSRDSDYFRVPKVIKREE